MVRTTQYQAVLVVVIALAGASCFAQSAGEATYKAKCQSCHGATGAADTTIGLALKVKPVSDPQVKKMSDAGMIDATKNGLGKMQAFKERLTDGQIKDVAAYFRTLVK